MKKLISIAIALIFTTSAIMSQVQQDTAVVSEDTSGVYLDNITEELMLLTYLPDTFLVQDDRYVVSTFVVPNTGEVLSQERFRQKVDSILQEGIPAKHPGREIVYLRPELVDGDNRKPSIYRTYRNVIPFLYSVDFDLPGSGNNKNEDLIQVRVSYYFTYMTIRKYE